MYPTSAYEGDRRCLPGVGFPDILRDNFPL
jgi:hypothetical protein